MSNDKLKNFQIQRRTRKNNDLYAVNDSGYNPFEITSAGCPLSIFDSTSPEASRQERQETLWANFFLQPRRLSSSTSLSAPSNIGSRRGSSFQKCANLAEEKVQSLRLKTSKVCKVQNLSTTQSEFGGVISRSWRAS